MGCARRLCDGIRQRRTGQGRGEIEFEDRLRRGTWLQGDHHRIGSRRARKAGQRIPLRPDEEIAAPGAQAAKPRRVTGAPRQRIELGIVVDPERDLRTGDRHSRRGDNADVERSDLGVAVEYIDLAVTGRGGEHLLSSCIGSHHPGVDEHGAARRLLEPAHIEVRLRLAGAEKIPLPVGPEFHPGMIVVAVGPARSINLARRNADRAQGGDRENRLFAAAADGAAHRRQGSGGAHVRSTVGDVLVAPVVDLEGGLAHGQALHPLPEQTVQDDAGGIEVFVIYAQGENKVEEEIVGDAAAPCHIGACLQGGAHLAEVEFSVIVGEVAERHPGVEPLEGFALGRGEFLPENTQELLLPVPGQLLLKWKLRAHRALEIACRNELFTGGSAGRPQDDRQVEEQLAHGGLPVEMKKRRRPERPGAAASGVKLPR